MPTIYVAARAPGRRTCRVLRDAPELRFVFHGGLTAVDYHPREPRFELLYLLVVPGCRRLRRHAEAAAPEGAGGERRDDVPAVSSVWQSANWAEREPTTSSGCTSTAIPTCGGS